MPIPMTTRTVRIDKPVSVDDDPVDAVAGAFAELAGLGLPQRGGLRS